jgi:hypothetical protein
MPGVRLAGEMDRSSAVRLKFGERLYCRKSRAEKKDKKKLVISPHKPEMQLVVLEEAR